MTEDNQFVPKRSMKPHHSIGGREETEFDRRRAEAIKHRMRNYESRVPELVKLAERSRRAPARSVSAIYWEMGHRIAEFAPRKSRSSESFLKRLSARLGRGFTVETLGSIRDFWKTWPEKQSFPLCWSHYVLLMNVSNKDAREFYKSEAERCGWSESELKTQIRGGHFERVYVFPREILENLGRAAQCLAILREEGRAVDESLAEPDEYEYVPAYVTTETTETGELLVADLDSPTFHINLLRRYYLSCVPDLAWRHATYSFTAKEWEYLYIMASDKRVDDVTVQKGEIRMNAVGNVQFNRWVIAEGFRGSISTLYSVERNLIKSGIIYRPSRGHVAFTSPKYVRLIRSRIFRREYSYREYPELYKEVEPFSFRVARSSIDSRLILCLERNGD